MKQFVLFCFLFLSLYIPGNAQSLQETRKLFSEGNYEQAKPGAEKLLKSTPSNGNYNYWYGACLFETGDKASAEPYLKTAVSKKVTDAYFYLGQLYYDRYYFDEAVNAYESYMHAGDKALRKSEAELLTEKAKRAARLLEHTEDIQIIDTVVVDKDRFFEYYRLSEESGFLTAQEDEKESVYTNQLQSKRYYAQADSNGVYKLYSQSKLIDKWGDQRQLSGEVNSQEDSNFPFVLNDGVTLYFASRGKGSIGGYDLFVTRYNNNTDTYLAPEQLGMPFNSIYNDYMLAIDELNGVGYFASDRLQEEGKVVIYTFIPNTEKKRVDTENKIILKNRALITIIQDTWREGEDYEALLQKVQESLHGSQKKEKVDFTFIINDNIAYHVLKDFDSDAAKTLFLELQQTIQKLDGLNKSLDENRVKYHSSSASVREGLKNTILKQEEQQEALSKAIEKLEIKVRNTEINHLRQSQQ